MLLPCTTEWNVCKAYSIYLFCANFIIQESDPRVYKLNNAVRIQITWCHIYFSQFCSDIMEELDTLLPLALACRDDSLQEIRANFVEACSKVATAVLARLEEKSKDVPSKAPLQNLYAALSTAIYVFQHFTMYSNLMRENSKKWVPFTCNNLIQM